MKQKTDQKKATPIRTPRDLGQALRQERKEQGLNQVELAGLSDVGNRFIVELEQGKATIELGKALQVAHMLGIRLESCCPDNTTN